MGPDFLALKTPLLLLFIYSSCAMGPNFDTVFWGNSQFSKHVANEEVIIEFTIKVVYDRF